MPKRVYDRAYASFRVWSETLDPLQVTLALMIPPDQTHRFSEPRLIRSKKGKIIQHMAYRHGHWSFSSEKWVDSPRLETHLDWLLKELEPKSEIVISLGKVHQTDFFCYASGFTDTPPSLPRSMRERADALGIKIEIDFYPQKHTNG